MAYVSTNDPVDVVASGENSRITQNFLNKGWVNWNYTLVA
jgi:hypothetical protein